MNNDRTATVGIVVAALIVGGIFIYSQHDTSEAAPLQEQRMCAEAAQKFAKSHIEESTAFAKITQRISSHYSVTYEKCFVELSTRELSDLGDRQHVTVSDAFENTNYADYFRSYRRGEKEDHLIDCKAKTPGHEFAECKNLNDWEAMVKPLMETGMLDSY